MNLLFLLISLVQYVIGCMKKDSDIDIALYIKNSTDTYEYLDMKRYFQRLSRGKCP